MHVKLNSPSFIYFWTFYNTFFNITRQNWWKTWIFNWVAPNFQVLQLTSHEKKKSTFTMCKFLTSAWNTDHCKTIQNLALDHKCMAHYILMLGLKKIAGGLGLMAEWRHLLLIPKGKLMFWLTAGKRKKEQRILHKPKTKDKTSLNKYNLITTIETVE